MYQNYFKQHSGQLQLLKCKNYLKILILHLIMKIMVNHLLWYIMVLFMPWNTLINCWNYFCVTMVTTFMKAQKVSSKVSLSFNPVIANNK